MEKPLLEKYLLETAAYDPRMALSDEILDQEELLVAVARAWTTDGDAIRAVIRERLKEIRNKLVMSATPYEVLPLRQALVEVAAILEDFERYTAEADARRKKDNEEGSPPESDAEETNS